MRQKYCDTFNQGNAARENQRTVRALLGHIKELLFLLRLDASVVLNWRTLGDHQKVTLSRREAFLLRISFSIL